jgi:hypothetical protein
LPVTVDENTAYDKKSNNEIYTIQNVDAEEYKIHGVDSDPFFMETISDGNCNTNKGRTCGRLWLKNGVELDREQQAEYTITVEARGRNNRIIESSDWKIQVRDENDNQPIFTPASRTLKCAENSRDGKVCGRVEATDLDAGNYGKVEYTLAKRTDHWKKRTGELETRQLGMFEIDSETGEVTMKNPQDWDAEVYEYVEIFVSAQDNPGKTSRNPAVTETIKIYLEDVNDNPPQVTDYVRAISVPELTAVGENIGTEKFGKKFSFRAEDKDIDPDNNEVKFEIVSPSTSSFDIINLDGNTAYLQIAEMLDYETRPKWDLDIRAYNPKGNPPKEENFNVVINVEDENEPPIWDDNFIEFEEGQVAGQGPTNGVQPHARDLDFEGSQKVTYSIIKDPMEFFSIDSKTGYITYKNDIPLDRECDFCDYTAGTYPLDIKACDPMDECATKTHHIFIKDKDDEGPRIDLDEQVCNELDEGYVQVKGSRDLTVVDRDDCKKDHCGPFQIDVVGTHAKKFKLVQKSNNVYMLRYIPAGKLDVGKVYEIQVRGFDNAKNEHVSTIKLNVCSCSVDESPTCANAYVNEGSGSLASIMAIIAAVLIVFSE